MKYVAAPKSPKVIPFQAVLYARRERPDVWPNLQKALASGDIVIGPPTMKDEFFKAGDPRADHKYVRRVFTGDPRHPWRYEYAEQLALPLGGQEPHVREDDEERPPPREQPQQLALFTIPQPRQAERRERPQSAPRTLELQRQTSQQPLGVFAPPAAPVTSPPAPAPASEPEPPAAPPPAPADDRFVLGSYVSKRGNLKRVAKFTRRVDREEWGVLAALAREHGGSYVREAGGFVFRDDAGYDTFMAALSAHPPPAPAPVVEDDGPVTVREAKTSPGFAIPQPPLVGTHRIYDALGARGWTGSIDSAAGGTVHSPDGKVTVTVEKLSDGKWSVVDDAHGYGLSKRRLSGPTGETREIRDSNGELVATVDEHGTEFITLSAALDAADLAVRSATPHPAAAQVIRAFRDGNESWHAGLQAGHALLALKRGDSTYRDGRVIQVTGDVSPSEVRSRPLGVHVKKRLEEHFRDQDGTTYYGAGTPQDAMTLWQQKVDGLKLVRDETMEQRQASPAWAEAGRTLDRAIADLEAQRPLFETIQQVTQGKRFAASTGHTAADEVETALRFSDDATVERKVSEPGWDRMPEQAPAPAAKPSAKTPEEEFADETDALPALPDRDQDAASRRAMTRAGRDFFRAAPVGTRVETPDGAGRVVGFNHAGTMIVDVNGLRTNVYTNHVDAKPDQYRVVVQQAPAAPPPPPAHPKPAQPATHAEVVAELRRRLGTDMALQQAAVANGLDNFELYARHRLTDVLVDMFGDMDDINGPGAEAVKTLIDGKEAQRQIIADLYRDLRPVARQPASAIPTGRVYGAMGMTAGERKKANKRALDLVAEAASRPLTQEERNEVARYSGKGGAGVGASNNQYFTRPDVAAAIWQRAAALAGDVKTALEPACGAGVFLETAPAGVRVTGVEIDPEVAAVARVLHGDRHEVLATSFEDYAIRHEGVAPVDVVITNAPFLVRTGGGVRLHKPDMANADRYFIDTALDQVKDGGVVAVLVHHSVMTGPDAAEFRARLAARAELVDAYRLPTDAFKHSHTEVTTDVIYLRKRPAQVGAALLAGGEDLARKLGTHDEAFIGGRWYETHPERVLGQVTTDWRGNNIVTGSADHLADALTGSAPADPGPAGKAVTLDEIKAATGQDEGQLRAVKRAAAAASVIPASGASKVVNGVTYILTGDPPRWRRADEIDDVAAVVGVIDTAAISEAKEIATSIEDLRKALDRGDYYQARHLRRQTADRVRTWVEAHGLPGEHAELHRLAKADRALMLMVGAVHGDGTLSDMLLRDPPSVVVGQAVNRGDLRTVAEHVAASVGHVNLADVARLWTGAAGHSEEEIRQKVLALEQFAVEESGEIVHLEDYLTGDVFGKADRLDGATDPKLVWQREQLDARIEARWRTLDDVEIQLRSGWVPPAALSAFLSSEAGQRITHWRYEEDRRVQIHYEDSWYTSTTTEGGKAKKDNGDSDFLLRYLNRGRLSERDRDRVAELEAAFAEWARGSTWREELEDKYNRLFFGDVRKEYSGGPLNLEGLGTEVTPKDYQNAAVRWAMDQGTGVLALDVGLGKTFTGILLARQAKAQGGARRPVFVVPKSVATNWQKEIERLTPGARVLVIGETSTEVTSGKNKGKRVSRSDDAEERNRKLALAMQNDYDAIIITRPAYERIPLRPETIERFEEDDFWNERAKQIEGATGKTMAATAKKQERVKAAFEAQAAARKFAHDKALVYWEDLGCDMLIADEAHAYKNLFEARQRFGQSPKFLGGSGTSKQSKDMQHKARVVREKTKRGGVFMLTATPTKNSPLEIYNMLAHIVPHEWEKRGIRNAEEFIDRYCVLEQKMVLNSNGAVEEALAVTGFKNLTELHDLMDRYMLHRTAEDVGLQIPEAKQVTEFVDMHPAQRLAYEQIKAEAEAAKNSPNKDEAKGLMFRTLDRMKKAATDLEILDPEAYSGWHVNSPKYRRAVAKILDGSKRGGQVVFIDSVDSHERLKSMLVAAGMKPEEIAIINAQVAPDSEQRYEIGERFNRGEVKVVIGNTATMGEGVNLQKRTTDIHHLDQPWDPGSMQQRNGRGVRQGNVNADVTIHTYLCKRSFDGFRNGTLQGKRGWLGKLRSGADTIGNDAMDAELSADDIMIMLADDPDQARAEIGKKREEQAEAWRAKKQADACQRLGQLLAMRERLRGLAHDSPTAEVLRNKIDLATRRLRAEEHLPPAARDLVDQEHVRAVVDPATGKVFVAGQIVQREGANYTVKKVDPGRQKLILEYVSEYGSSYSRDDWTDVSAAGRLYELTQQTDADAFNAAVDKIAAGDGKQFRAWESLASFRPELVAEHADLVATALGRAFRASQKVTDKAPMVGPDGAVHVVTPEQARHRPELRMLIPAGADWTRLVDAATQEAKADRARNPRMWESSLGYGNSIVNAVSWNYGEKPKADLIAAVKKGVSA